MKLKRHNHNLYFFFILAQWMVWLNECISQKTFDRDCIVKVPPLSVKTVIKNQSWAFGVCGSAVLFQKLFQTNLIIKGTYYWAGLLK